MNTLEQIDALRSHLSARPSQKRRQSSMTKRPTGIQFARKETIQEGWDAFEFSLWACRIDASKAKELLEIFSELVALAGGEAVGSVRVADDAERGTAADRRDSKKGTPE